MKINQIHYDFSQAIPLTRDLKNLELSPLASNQVDGFSDDDCIINLNARVNEYFEKKISSY